MAWRVRDWVTQSTDPFIALSALMDAVDAQVARRVRLRGASPIPSPTAMWPCWWAITRTRSRSARRRCGCWRSPRRPRASCVASRCTAGKRASFRAAGLYGGTGGTPTTRPTVPSGLPDGDILIFTRRNLPPPGGQAGRPAPRHDHETEGLDAATTRGRANPSRLLTVLAAEPPEPCSPW